MKRAYSPQPKGMKGGGGGGGEREWKVSVLTGCQYLAGRLVKIG